MKPTIKDVAKLAGVSFKTVSRVINNEEVVGDKLKAKVWAAIKELNYHPNLSARGLRGAISSIGFIYDNPNSNYVISMQNGILSVCLGEGYELVVRPCESDADNISQQISEMLDRSRVGGVILTPPVSENAAVLSVLEEKGVAVVRVISGDKPPPDADRFPCVYVNDRKAAYDITEHLLSMGHKSLAFLAGDASHKSSWERQEGFEACMRAQGINVDEDLILPGNFAFDSGVERTLELLALEATKRPSAIFAANDEIAAGALFAARLKSVNVPEQLAIAGFEDSPFSRQTWPKLTTAAQSEEFMAEQATKLLIQKLRSQSSGDGIDSIPLVPSLIVRESTQPKPEAN